MLVTLPFVLLLSRRLAAPAALARASSRDSTLASDTLARDRRSPRRWTRVIEKLPFLALAVPSSVVTFVVQRGGRRRRTRANLLRSPCAVENALVAYATYLCQAIWPAVSSRSTRTRSDTAARSSRDRDARRSRCPRCLAILLARSRPYLLVGWLWYLGTLVPVIGLLQVGAQSHADRYTYLPLSASRSRSRAARGISWRAGASGPLVGAVIAYCSARLDPRDLASESDVEERRSTLFRARGRRTCRTIPTPPDARPRPPARAAARPGDRGVRDHTAPEAPATRSRSGTTGMALELQGRAPRRSRSTRVRRARPRARRVPREPRAACSRRPADGRGDRAPRGGGAGEPEHATARANLGAALLAAGRIDEAIEHLERALALEPGLAGARRNLDAARAAKRQPTRH
jgi:hypothetical protein